MPLLNCLTIDAIAVSSRTLGLPPLLHAVFKIGFLGYDFGASNIRKITAQYAY